MSKAMKVHYDHKRKRTVPNVGLFMCGLPWVPQFKIITREWKRVTCKRCLAQRKRGAKR